MVDRNRRQEDFITDHEQRLIEVEEARLAVKFGNRKRYFAHEYEAIYQELVDAGLDDEERRDPAAIEAVFRRLNEIDEVAKARSMIMGSRGLPNGLS
jgi:hypothetical protein